MKMIITEQQLNLIIEKTWIEQGYDYVTDSLSKLIHIDIDSLMEGFREFLESGTGMVIQVLLDMVPEFGGPIINMGAWAALTVYDILQGITKNKWNWFHIIVDIVGVITTGPGGKWIKKALGKVSKFGTSSLEFFVSATKKYAPEAFNYILKMIKSISGVTSKISGFLDKMLVKLGGKLKDTMIYKAVKWFKSSLSKIPEFLVKIEKTFGKYAAKAVEKATHFGKHYATHNVRGALVAGAASAVAGAA